jgi:hypothetical protein
MGRGAAALIILVAGWAAGQPATGQVSPPPADKPAQAGPPPPGTITPATPQESPASIEFGAARVPASKAPKKPGGSELFLAPVPFSNPTIGAGLGLGAGYIFHPNRADTVSPPSTLMVGGLGSDNGTLGAFVGARLYLSQDRYRISGGIAGVDVHYDYFGVGTDAAESGIEVPLEQELEGFLFDGLVRVAPKLFAGIGYMFGTSKTSIEAGEETPPAQDLSSRELDTDISAISAILEGDRRDNTFFPTTGDRFQFNAEFHDEAWGDDFAYQIYALRYTGYRPLGKRQVLAYNAVARAVSGDAPFFALSQVGRQDGLRGYVSGKYRDQSLLSFQIEYRRMYPNRFGFVLFAGGSEVAEDLGAFNTNDIVGSVGVGLRYQLTKQNPLNYRIDYAYGKDGSTWYFFVGEAF